MYWCANRYFFVETNTLHDWVKASLIYNTRPQAMWAYENNDITWIESYPISQAVKVPAIP
jgi:hypothetical protein